MTFEPDIVFVDNIEAAQMREPIRAAKTVGLAGRVAVAVVALSVIVGLSESEASTRGASSAALSTL
jgi:hypothetical protein